MREIALLNGLLVSEQQSVAPRLVEASVFIPPDAVRAEGAIRRMARSSREHTERLFELILDLGGIPAPRHYDTATADLHFQDLSRMMPRLIDDQRNLVEEYTWALPQLASIPQAAKLVASILDRHKRDFQVLEQLATQPARQAG